MKCLQCHHLNISTEAECFMCGATLEVGLPPTHPVMYVLVGACVFLPVFAEIGGFQKIFYELGVLKPTSRTNGFSRWAAWLVGVVGVRGVLYLTKLDFSVPRQISLGILITAACWLLYSLLNYGLIREGNTGRSAFSDARPAKQHLLAYSRFEAPGDRLIAV